MKASNDFEKAIASFLETEKLSDPKLSEALAKEGKTLADCCNYIIQEVKKLNVSAMADDEVFNLAKDYFFDEETKAVKETKCKVVVSSKDIKPKKEKPAKKVPANPQKSNESQMSIFDMLVV